MKPLFHRISGRLPSQPLAMKLLSFSLIGLGNTVVDFGIFTFAYTVLGLPLVLSNVIAWYIAVSSSYVLNSKFTFHAESGRVLRRKDYFQFVLSGIVGAILSTTTLVVLSHFIPVLAAKLVSIAVAFASNFTMSHFVVFRAPNNDRAS